MTWTRHRSVTAATAALVLALLATAAVRADDDHDRARAGVQRGELLPLRTVLDMVGRDFVGRVLDVELEEEDGAILYEIELLAPGGRKIELVYDARNGQLLKAKGRDLDSARRRPETQP